MLREKRKRWSHKRESTDAGHGGGTTRTNMANMFTIGPLGLSSGLSDGTCPKDVQSGGLHFGAKPHCRHAPELNQFAGELEPVGQGEQK